MVDCEPGGQKGIVTLARMLDDLKAAGICSGDILVVHSSLKSIGWVEGGPVAVVEALVRSVNPGGTVLFPGLTFNGSATEFLRENELVDIRERRSHNGAIPRAAGECPKALRSHHPTHTGIAIGPRAAELLSGDQDSEGPVGAHSPFALAAGAGAKILLIGTTNDSNTTLHYVEELAAPYVFNGEEFAVRSIDMAGREHVTTVKGYTTSTPRDFCGIEDRMLTAGMMTMHMFGQADMRVVDARRMVDEVTQWLREDPMLLTKRD